MENSLSESSQIQWIFCVGGDMADSRYHDRQHGQTESSYIKHTSEYPNLIRLILPIRLILKDTTKLCAKSVDSIC